MNKKGFTLIELLAVIVIIALIVIVVAPSATKLISGAKRDTQDVQFMTVEDALKKYISKNALTLGDTASVCISDLKQAGLLEDKKIYNPDTDEEYTGCFALVWNSEYNQYDYTYSGGGSGHKTYPDIPEYVEPVEPGGGGFYPAGDGNDGLCKPNVSSSSMPLAEYGFLASESDIAYNMWTYTITGTNPNTAVITGINYDCMIYEYDAGSEYPEMSINDDIDYYFDYRGYDFSSSYYSDFDYIGKIVVPSKVKLNSSGQYDPNGTEYTIKQAYFDTSTDKFKAFQGNISEIIFPNGMEKVFGLNGGYSNLSFYRLPSNLVYMPTISGIDGCTDVYIPSSITKIPAGAIKIRGDFTWQGDFERFGSAGKVSLYLPSTITEIGKMPIENGFSSFISYSSYFYETFSIYIPENSDIDKTKVVEAFEDVFEYFYGKGTFKPCMDEYTNGGSYYDGSVEEYCHDVDYISPVIDTYYE